MNTSKAKRIYISLIMFSSHVCAAVAPGYTNKDDCTWESESLRLLISEFIVLGLVKYSKYRYI